MEKRVGGQCRRLRRRKEGSDGRKELERGFTNDKQSQGRGGNTKEGP